MQEKSVLGMIGNVVPEMFISLWAIAQAAVDGEDTGAKAGLE